jgi:hypothetical protein
LLLLLLLIQAHVLQGECMHWPQQVSWCYLCWHAYLQLLLLLLLLPGICGTIVIVDRSHCTTAVVAATHLHVSKLQEGW